MHYNCRNHESPGHKVKLETVTHSSFGSYCIQELIIPNPYYYSEGRGEWKDDIKDYIKSMSRRTNLDKKRARI